MAPNRRWNQRRTRRPFGRSRSYRYPRRRVSRVRSRAQVFRADHVFALPTAPRAAGDLIWANFSTWWMLLIECVGLICSWVLSKQAASLNSMLDEKVDYVDGTKKAKYIIGSGASREGLVINSAIADVYVPIAVATTAVVSVDNLINQSPIIEDRFLATPASAPWPFNEVDHYRRYFSTRYTQYRIKRVTFVLEPSDAAIALQGRWTMAFTPMAANQPFTRCFDPKTKATNSTIIPFPTPVGMLNSPLVKQATHAKSMRLTYRPSGFWADWQPLGYDLQSRADKTYPDAMANVEWTWDTAGPGSRPFGMLDITREDAVEKATLVQSLSGRYNTARIRTHANIELRGMEVSAWSGMVDVESSCSRRILRGFWVSTMPGGFDKTRLFPATKEQGGGVYIKLRDEKVLTDLTLESMEIRSPQSEGED